jgi:uncharacterized protein YggE
MRNIDRTITIPLITVLFIFICLFTFFKLFGPIPFFVQNITTTKTSLFSVDGVGEATAIPDTAMISFGVSKTASTVESAKNQVNEIANKITQDLKNLGVSIKDIKTTNYSVSPQYDYSGGTQRLTGYTVDTNMQVKLQPIDKASNAIDITTKDGATQVSGVQFIVDDTKQKELLNETRKKAINDAKDKAQSLSSAAGMRLGRIVDIKENAQNNPRPVPLLMSAEKSGGGEPTQLNPGENTISTTITLSYETY